MVKKECNCAKKKKLKNQFEKNAKFWTIENNRSTIKWERINSDVYLWIWIEIIFIKLILWSLYIYIYSTTSKQHNEMLWNQTYCFNWKTRMPTWTKLITFPKTKNMYEFKSIFYALSRWKTKKIPNMNSLYQMKSFDTKIDCFGGWNWCQRYLSFSIAGI